MGGGAVPCAHFSILPSTPQAVSASEIGSANWLRPGTAEAIVPNSPARPPAFGLAVTAESSAVMSDAADAERGFLAVQEIADGVAERAIDLAEDGLGVLVEQGAEQVDDRLQLIGGSRVGRDGCSRRGYRVVDERQQPFEQADRHRWPPIAVPPDELLCEALIGSGSGELVGLRSGRHSCQRARDRRCTCRCRPPGSSARFSSRLRSATARQAVSRRRAVRYCRC